MAKKKVEKNTLVSVIDTIKVKVQDINKDVLVASEEALNDSIKASKKWQGLFANGMKKGTDLLGEQQTIALDTIEALVGQVKHGDMRLRKLLGLENFSFENIMKGDLKQLTEIVEETVATVSKTAKSVVEDVREEVEGVAQKATETVNSFMGNATTQVKDVTPKAKAAVAKTTKKATAKAKTTAKKAVKATTSKATKAATTTEKVATTAKKVTKKATSTAKKATTAAVKTTKKVTTPVAKTTTKVAKKATTTIKVNPTDLTKIEGIGPKIKEILTKGGIANFEQLAAAKPEAVKEILLAAGSRYRLHNPATWGTQAALAAKGDWDALTKLQGELKGGK